VLATRLARWRRISKFIGRGYESWTLSGDQRVLALASRATEAGYGRMNPMRNYVYGR